MGACISQLNFFSSLFVTSNIEYRRSFVPRLYKYDIFVYSDSYLQSSSHLSVHVHAVCLLFASALLPFCWVFFFSASKFCPPYLPPAPCMIGSPLFPLSNDLTHYLSILFWSLSQEFRSIDDLLLFPFCFHIFSHPILTQREKQVHHSS